MYFAENSRKSSNAPIITMQSVGYSLLLCLAFPILSTALVNITHINNTIVVETKTTLATNTTLLSNKIGDEKPSYSRLSAGQKITVYEAASLFWQKCQFLVVNVGQTPITVQFIERFPDYSSKVLQTVTLNPSENTLFTLCGLHAMTITAENLSRDRVGYVCAAPGQNTDTEGSSPLLTDARAISALKKIAAFGLKKIPYVGAPLGIILDMFWPQQKTNVWDEVKDNVEKAINHAIAQLLQDLYNGEINSWKDRIQQLYREYNSSSNVASHYMNIAEDMIGLQSKLSSITELDRRFYAMPYYSTATLMMVSFYTFGIDCDKSIGLTAENVKNIADYRNNTIVKANQYLPKLFTDMLEYQYQNLDARYAYSNFAEIRRLYSEYGSEYIKIWNHIQANASGLIQFDEIHYSTNFLGSSDGKLNALMAQNPPLEIFTPKLLSPGERIKINDIGTYWQTYDNRRYLAGVFWRFLGGETYNAGVQTLDGHLVSLGWRYIIKLVVKLDSDSRIVQIAYYLSENEPTVYHGSGEGAVREWTWDGNDQFVLASLFASFDENSNKQHPPFLKSRLNNLAVSYQRHNFIYDDDYVDMKCK